MTKTVRVRIAVEVDEHGNYCAFGSNRERDPRQVIGEWDEFHYGDFTEEFWIEADVPVPEHPTEGVIKGEVRDA
jgi:hypothetical protein